MRSLKLCALIMLFPFISIAQQYNYTQYSINEGLPQSEVWHILEDSRSILWLGTNGGGLCRFNGYEFKIYTEEDGLPSNMVFLTHERNNGDLLIYTILGLALFDGKEIKAIPNSPQGYCNKAIKDPANPNRDWFFINTQQGKSNDLIYFEGDSVVNFTDLHKETFKTNTLINILKRPDNKIEVVTTNQQFVIDGNDLKPSDLFAKQRQQSNKFLLPFIIDKKKRTWFTTLSNGIQDKVYYSLNDTLIEFSFPNDVSPFPLSIQEDKQGNIWFIGMRSIVKWDGSTFQFLGNNIGINNFRINYIGEDHENNIWICTSGRGVIKYTDNRFISYNKNDGIDPEFVRTFVETKDGTIWLGATDKFIFSIHKDEIKRHPLPVQFKNSLITDLEIINNRMLISSTVGLWEFKSGKFKKVNKQFNLPENIRISDIEKANNKIIFTSSQKGIFIWENGTVTKHNNIVKFSNFLYGTISTENGELWSVGEFGVTRITKDTSHFYTIENGLSNSLVIQTLEDKYGKIWLATYGGGIDCFNGETFSNFSTKNSKINSNIIYSLVEDEDGNIWAGTQLGISQLILDKNGNVTAIRNFDKSDGFSGLETNGRAAFKDSKGNLWFGTIKGAQKFNPKENNRKKIAPITHINGLRLFYETIDWQSEEYTKYHLGRQSWFNLPKSLVVPHDLNHFTFDLEAISYVQPEKNLFQWKLEGLDKDWSPKINKREAVYSNIPPGKYTFKVRSTNNQGVWSKEEKHFSFTITPPIYLTTWFLTLSAVIITTIIFGLVRLRIKQLKRDKEKLERKVLKRTAEIEQKKEEIQSQRDEIEEQRDEIVTQRDEILRQRDIANQAIKATNAGLRYARRIQSAVMPPMETIQQYFPDSFVYYKPKDIVSGDFYWFRHIKQYYIMAVADCTGHGVPGAIMSMLGVSMLNELARNEKIIKANEFLEEMRKNTKTALRQTGRLKEAHDGMDIAIVVYDTNTKELHYSGAHNPIYLIKNKQEDVPCNNKKTIATQNGQCLHEIKATPNPIGVHVKEENFKNYTFKMQKGDSVYLFTDGYIDQFGGQMGYKFMAKRFKKLLVDNIHLPMHDQKELLNKEMNNWKGEIHPQIDDMLVIGLRFD